MRCRHTSGRSRGPGARSASKWSGRLRSRRYSTNSSRAIRCSGARSGITARRAGGRTSASLLPDTTSRTNLPKASSPRRSVAEPLRSASSARSRAADKTTAGSPAQRPGLPCGLAAGSGTRREVAALLSPGCAPPGVRCVSTGITSARPRAVQTGEHRVSRGMSLPGSWHSSPLSPIAARSPIHVTRFVADTTLFTRRGSCCASTADPSQCVSGFVGEAGGCDGALFSHRGGPMFSLNRRTRTHQSAE